MVEQLTDSTVTLYILRPVSRVTLPLSAILSADYARGDEGQA